MSVRIEPTDHNTFLINGREVYQDTNNNWVAKDAKTFTSQELRAWSSYKKLAIDGKRKNLTMTITK